MAHIYEILPPGKGKTDASIRFIPGPNVVLGDSDTGKSYLLRYLYYILGAQEMTKVIKEAEGYELVWLEIRNAAQQILTLERHLTGDEIRAYDIQIEDVLVTRNRNTADAATTRRNMLGNMARSWHGGGKVNPEHPNYLARLSIFWYTR